MNLLGNAADALADSDVRPKEVRVQIALADAAGRVTCVVEDNAGGMSPATLARIMEPYFTTKEVGRGTGLGLPVVRQIVESYGGRLTIESVLGKGTRVAFDLPCGKSDVSRTRT